MASIPATPTKRKRRWLRFSLRTLLIVSMLLSAALGFAVNRLNYWRKLERAIGIVESIGGNVTYDQGLPIRYNRAAELFGFKVPQRIGPVHVVPGMPVRADQWKALTELGVVEEITLEGHWVNNEAMPIVAAVPGLRDLFLVDTLADQHGVRDLRRCASLRSFGLAGVSVTDDVLSSVGELQQLEHFAVLKSPATSGGLEPVGRLKKLRKLIVFEVPEFGDEGMEHLSELQELECLSLPRTSVGDKGMAQLIHFPRLKKLYLTETNVSDAGLAHIGRLHELEALHLSSTLISDEGMKSLASLKKLKDLWIDDTSMTDAGLAHLPLFANRCLIIVGPHVTRGGAQAFVQARPACDVRGTEGGPYTFRATIDGLEDWSAKDGDTLYPVSTTDEYGAQ